MKKIVSIMLVLCIVLSVSSVFAANTEIIIDGKKVTIGEGMGSITKVEDVTFVPVRFLLEHFGFNVNWEGETRTVLARHENGESLMMQIDNPNLFYFDNTGSKKDLAPMEKAPYLNGEEERTYLPLNAIANALNYTVGRDEETDTVTLSK